MGCERSGARYSEGRNDTRTETIQPELTELAEEWAPQSVHNRQLKSLKSA
jgi:hypothetical protein